MMIVYTMVYAILPVGIIILMLVNFSKRERIDLAFELTGNVTYVLNILISIAILYFIDQYFKAGRSENEVAKRELHKLMYKPKVISLIRIPFVMFILSQILIKIILISNV